MKKNNLMAWAIALVFLLGGTLGFLFPAGYTSLQSAHSTSASIYQGGEVIYSEENDKIASSFDFVVKGDSLYVIRFDFVHTPMGKRYQKWGSYSVHVSGLIQEAAKNQASYETEHTLPFHNKVSQSFTGDQDAVNRAMQWCVVNADCGIAIQESVSSYPFTCGGQDFLLLVKTDSSVVYSRSFSVFLLNYILIGCGVFVGALPLVGIIRQRRYRNLVNLYNAGEYPKVAKTAGKYIAAILRESVRLRNYNRSGFVNILDELYLMLAVSRYAENNKEGFLDNIGKIHSLEAEKNLWLTVYYLIDGDLIQAQNYYTVLCSAPAFDKERHPYLDGLFLLKRGETDKAYSVLNSAVKNIHHPLLRQIVMQVLNSPN